MDVPLEDWRFGFFRRGFFDTGICRYAGAWPREQFSKFGIKYEPSSKTKSELYTDLLPLVNSARIQLLDQPRMISQLLSLERRTGRCGSRRLRHRKTD